MAAAAGNGALTLSWEVPADNGGRAAHKYIVQWRSGQQEWSSVEGRRRVTVAVTNPDMAAFRYRVRAVNWVRGGGDGSFSDPLTVTPRAWATSAARRSAPPALDLPPGALAAMSRLPDGGDYGVEVSNLPGGTASRLYIEIGPDARTLTVAAVAESALEYLESEEIWLAGAVDVSVGYGSARLCVAVGEAPAGRTPALFHREDGTWRRIGGEVEHHGGLAHVCGETATFSPFASTMATTARLAAVNRARCCRSWRGR